LDRRGIGAIDNEILQATPTFLPPPGKFPDTIISSPDATLSEMRVLIFRALPSQEKILRWNPSAYMLGNG
jgi:hypothetical protein